MTTTPNPALLEAFGTGSFWRRNLEKTAAPPLPLQVGAPLAYMGALAYSHDQEARQVLEGQILTEMFRQVEHGRMAPVQSGLRGRGPALSDIGSAAQQLRPMSAYEAMMGLKYSSMRRELEKEAGVGQMLGGAVGGLGRALGGAGRRLAGTTAQRATGMAGPLSGAGMRMRQMGVQMQQRGQQWSRFGMGATGRFQQAAARQGVLPTPRPPAAVPPAAAAARAAPVTGAAPSTIWPGIRNKALLYGGGAAALGGAGYTGYKGLQTAKDYMMQPTYASSSWGPPGMMPAGGVNEFGYQDVSY